MIPMRGIRLFAFVIAVALLVPASALGAAQMNLDTDVKSGVLVEQYKEFDGKEITFRGEVIGERMVRGGHAWLHINDDAYFERNIEEGQPLGGMNSGHAVWIPTPLTDELQYFGDYRNEGDIVRVKGTFNAACPQHGGDMDIHATELELLRPGHPVVDPIRPAKTAAALVLGALAAFLFWLSRTGWGPRFETRRPQPGRRTAVSRGGDR